ncbi:MAG: SNF2-related protein, partial [Desulfobacterales bacterium]|nr:SNF2-related protein [Desulfobacterales bacterium]
LKTKRQSAAAAVRSEKADFFYCESGWFRRSGNYEKALVNLKKALRLDPDNKPFLEELVHLGHDMVSSEVQLSGLSRLYDSGQMEDVYLPLFIDLLAKKGQYQQVLEVAEILLARLAEMKIANKRKIRTNTIQLQKYCHYQLEFEQTKKDALKKAALRPPPPDKKTPEHPPVGPSPQKHKESIKPVPNIPVVITTDDASFQIPLSGGRFMRREQYELALEGHRIRFRDSFENLICLSGLQDVRSLWYQEETARKVLKSFRGRALLSDEVGLGKTIEASIILKEYIQRGIVKSALILTPSTLVSQWQDELQAKFGLDFPSTDDADFHKKGIQFWQAPYILASINQAKSKRNIAAVIEREYDLVIVDEAHHLKNRNTLNWKLVNSLKKRFLLLLTATPVENNLMELYNLITLLKPGQLKTASAFRNEFMTRGDPTGPQNRSRLKELLGQVMIRNTRALAKVGIPPRFAQTIRVKPGANETALYTRITDLVHHINATDRNGNKLLLKNLLAEAGSSPLAVELTLQRLLAGRDFLWDHEKEIRAIHNLCRTMGDTEKNKVLFNLIRSTNGKKLVFVNYLGTLDHLSTFLSWNDIAHAVFHGRLNNQQKDEAIRSFREEKDILVTTEIGGEGRNLQFCHQMINYDLPWNPMKIEQRIGRIHRLGQQSEVMIYNLCAAESIEEYILDILDRKINMFEMVIGEIDMILGRIRDENDFSDMVYDIWTNSLSKKEREHGFDQLAVRLQRSKSQYEKTRELDEKLFGENYEL